MSDLPPITQKFGADTTQFKAALSELNRSIRVIESEFRATAATMDDWSSTSEGLEARQAALTKQIELQQRKVSALQSEYQRVVKEKGETSRAAQELQIKLNRETETLGKMQTELRQTDQRLEEVGSESKQTGKQIDDLGDKTQQAERKMSGFGAVLGKLGGFAKTAAVGLAAAGVAAGLAVASLGAQVVRSFSELEQNLGGSEAVFGEYAERIQRTAEDAYKNMGVSASEYLAIANKMGSLFQGSGIDQQRSLELTEAAMQRAADMASVMGIDTQMALDSIAGAAKGNFTMMDNLGVAMNATTIEAYALSKGLDFAWNSATNAEKAEVAMQMFFEQTEQYAGNFARESRETVAGSIGLWQAALGSFVGGLGNANADMSKLTANLVDAFQVMVKNIVPVLDNLIAALPEAVGGILPEIGKILPPLIQTATGLFRQVLSVLVGLLPELIPVAVEAILAIVNALVENAPVLLGAGIQIIGALIGGVVTALPKLIPAALGMVTSLVGFIVENLPLLIQAGIQIILALINGIAPMLPRLVEAAVEMIVTLAQGLTEAIPQLLPVIATIIPQIIVALIENLPMLITAAIQLIMALVQGLISALPILIQQAPVIVQALVTAIVSNLPLIIDAALQLITALVEAIVLNLPLLGEAALQILDALVTGIGDLLPMIGDAAGQLIGTLVQAVEKLAPVILEVGRGIVTGIWEGILEKAEWFYEQVKSFFGNMIQSAKDAIGWHSPPAKFVELGKGMAGAVGLGWNNMFAQIQRDIQQSMAGLANVNLGSSMPAQFVPSAAGAAAPITINFQVTASSEFDFYKMARMVADEIHRRR